MTLAKSLGGGLPLGAMLVSEKLEGVFIAGDHKTTFGGNPLSCATGLAAIDFISSRQMQIDVEEKSKWLFTHLENLRTIYPFITDIRGRGLMIGIEVGEKAYEIQHKAYELGLLLNITN